MKPTGHLGNLLPLKPFHLHGLVGVLVGVLGAFLGGGLLIGGIPTRTDGGGIGG